VSAVPAEIAGIGSTAQKLRVSPGFDPLKAQVGPEEYFVLSRIDGVQSLKDVLLATGLPVERAIAIVTKLRSIGALLLPGEQTAPAPAAVPTQARIGTGTGRTGTATPARPMTPPHGVPAMRPGASPLRMAASSRPPNVEAAAVPMPDLVFDFSLTDATAEELTALAEDVELDDTDRRRVLALMRLADGRDPYALLGVPAGSEPRVLKRAYFTLSKEIHPDRYYGKQLGSFATRMASVFDAVSRAYARLTNPEKAAARSGAHASGADQQPQTPLEYAAELFDRACAVELAGEVLDAMKLFAAAVRIDPQTRYLRRATICALRAEQPKTAVEYAKKAQSQAADDPSVARLLATAFRAAGKLADAEEVLVMAMALKTENDVLMNELRNDLAEVRRMLQGA
jgi:tetratricopeptide (TPR) repeat protein